jgi:hypothetical protein
MAAATPIRIVRARGGALMQLLSYGESAKRRVCSTRALRRARIIGARDRRGTRPTAVNLARRN